MNEAIFINILVGLHSRCPFPYSSLYESETELNSDYSVFSF